MMELSSSKTVSKHLKLVSKHYLTYAEFPPYANGFATAAIMQLRIAPKTAGIP